MGKTAVLVGIGIAIVAIIGGILAVLTYSDGTDFPPTPVIDSENETGQIIELRLGEAASMGDGP